MLRAGNIELCKPGENELGEALQRVGTKTTSPIVKTLKEQGYRKQDNNSTGSWLGPAWFGFPKAMRTTRRSSPTALVETPIMRVGIAVEHPTIRCDS